MALDFTSLNRLAYQGCETVEEQEQKDALIDQGYTIVESAENPFLQASEALSPISQHRPSTASTKASGRKIEALARASDGSDYKRLYRIAHDFHQRHNPPTIDRDYWRTHKVGIDDTPELEAEYWRRAYEDVLDTAKAHSNDPFLTGLLIAVYEELEREAKALRIIAQKQASEAVS